MTIGTLPFDQETIRQRASEVNEAAWLTEFRLQALAQATELQCQLLIKRKLTNGTLSEKATLLSKSL